MKDLLSLQMRSMGAWWEMMETGAAAWTTVAHRLPMLATEGLTGAEGVSMVSEKVDAAMTGAFDAGLATIQIAGAAMLTPLTPQGIALAGWRIADAATMPARRKVKANALRLSAKI